MLSYQTGKVVGALNVPGYGLCSDKKGDVFVLDDISYVIVEYAHGGTSPLQMLDNGDYALGCSVDPVSGNLAVTDATSGTGGVLIYPNAQEAPQGYSDSDVYVFGLCGYDARGNLFFGGIGETQPNLLAELPKGGSIITNFTLGDRLDALGGVQWDGKYITLTDPPKHEIYRLSLGKSSGKVVGVTHLRAWQVPSGEGQKPPYLQTWVRDNVFLGQTSPVGVVGVWSYPAGGNPRKAITFGSGVVSISGMTISEP
jgi:hypothetical protein